MKRIAMGLDFTEMIIVTEERFGIEINDKESEYLETPEALIKCIKSKLNIDNDINCGTVRSFNILRGVLTRNFGATRKEVTLDSPVKSFIQNDTEKVYWNELGELLLIKSWPSLTYPSKILNARRFFFLLYFLLVLVFCIKSGLYPLWIISIIPIVYIEKKFFSNWKTLINPEFQTLRDLMTIIPRSKKYIWNDDTITEEVNVMLMEMFSIKEEDYRLDAHFIKDFGID